MFIEGPVYSFIYFFRFRILILFITISIGQLSLQLLTGCRVMFVYGSAHKHSYGIFILLEERKYSFFALRQIFHWKRGYYVLWESDIFCGSQPCSFAFRQSDSMETNLKIGLRSVCIYSAIGQSKLSVSTNSDRESSVWGLPYI